jgi:hypothetical protein
MTYFEILISKSTKDMVSEQLCGSMKISWNQVCNQVNQVVSKEVNDVIWNQVSDFIKIHVNDTYL